MAVHYWLPHVGGVEHEAREQAVRLVARGHRVTVVTSAVRAPAGATLEDGVRVRRVPAWNLLESRFGLPYPLFSPVLANVMKEEARRTDVVFAHTHTFLSTLAAAHAARRAGVPFVLNQNNPYIDYPFPLNRVQDIADRTIGRYTIGAAERLTAISRFTAGYLERLAPAREVEVMYLGVDTDRFTPVSRERRSEIRSRLGIPDDRFVLLTVRRLFYRNGLDTLLDAAALLRERDDLWFVIGGSGPEGPALEDQVRREGLDSVDLAGSVDDSDLVDHFRAADAFVLPSRTAEGFGLVIAEAAAVGIPTIATRSGAPPELIEEGVTGSLVEVESPGQLAAAIAGMADAPEATELMGARARERVLALDWERSIDHLESILASVVRPRTP